MINAFSFLCQGSAGTVVRLTLEREGLGGMVRIEASLKRAALLDHSVTDTLI